jgi:sarcosine reductase
MFAPGVIMRLELASFPVRDVQFADQTTYQNGVLTIDRGELISIILKDCRIVYADVDVAFPGEKTRIVHVRDIVEPRVKVSGTGCVFPGILGPIETAGEGRTNRLSGLAIVSSVDYKMGTSGGAERERSGLMDMWGAGAGATSFGSSITIVVIFQLAADVKALEAHKAIQLAELKVAHRLAEVTRDKVPEEVEVFDLYEADESLPRVIYIMGCKTGPAFPNFGNAYYGLPIFESLPLFIHPNEVFDGALTPDTRRGSSEEPTTWDYQNHPTILGLYKRHGKTLNFLGVIFQRTRFDTEHGKQVAAGATAQLAKLLKADGAIMTWTTSSGNNFLEIMLTVQACERKSVKVVLLGPEWGGRNGTEAPLLFYVSEATSIVTTGGVERDIVVSKPTKVIGGGDGQLSGLQAVDTFSPWREGIPPDFSIIGSIDWWGATFRTCKEY